jgi:hypothetical protein
VSRVLNKKALAWIGSTPKTKNTAAELGRGLSAHDEQRKDSNNMSLARLEFVTVDVFPREIFGGNPLAVFFCSRAATRLADAANRPHVCSAARHAGRSGDG